MGSMGGGSNVAGGVSWEEFPETTPIININIGKSIGETLINLGTSLAVSYAISYVSGLINKQSNAKTNAGSVSGLTDRMHVVRSSVAPRHTVYGEVPVSGPLVFAASKGKKNVTLHLVVVLADHESDAIGDISLNEDVVGALDPITGKCTTGKFKDKVKIRKHLGTLGDPADADLIAADVGWTAAHTLSGCTYIYVQLTYDAKVFTTGIPNIKALVRGKKLYDPRTGLTRWSDNWALCCRDYVAGRHGIQATADEIDEAGMVLAADISDEQVPVTTFSAPVTADLVNHTVKPTSSPTPYRVATGDRVVFSTDDTLPAGLTAGSEYFISATPAVAGNLYVSSSLANAFAGVNVSVTGAGSGSHTMHVACTQAATVPSGSTTRLALTAPVLTPLPAEAALDLRTGDVVIFTKSGSVSSTVVSGASYFAIRRSASELELASSLANALAGVAIVHGISIGAGGKVRIGKVSQRRYTCNGTCDASQTPREVMTDMLTGGVGMLTYTSGRYSILAGAWRAPVSRVLTADDLRGDLTVNTRTARRELFNAVRGTYPDPSKAWQPSDFPTVRNATYRAQDGGEEYWRDVKLNFTTNAQEAQRIGKVYLEASRQGMTCTFPAKYTAFAYSVGDVVPVSIPALGWAPKLFQVMGWSLAKGGGVDLSLREIASTIWDWNLGDATHVDPAPDTELPDMTLLDAPLDLLLTSGQSTLLETGDGTVISRIKAIWSGVESGFVGGYDLEYKKSTEADWLSAPVNSGVTMAYISPVEDGVAYDVRVRAVSIYPGIFSVWTEVLGHNVAGKGEAPADVTGFFIQQSGASVLYGWDHSSDADLAGYEIRFNPLGNHRWEDATPLTRVTKGTQITTIKTPPGSWNFMIKARDNSGLYSENAGEVEFVVASDLLVVGQREESLFWETGTLVNFLIHGTRALIPKSTVLAFDGGWDTFDRAVFSPYALCTYESQEIDIQQDGAVRVYGAPISRLMPGEVGIADPKLVVDYRTASGDYDGYDSWQIGFVTGRYFKFKCALTTPDGLACIRSLNNTIDADKRSETWANLAVPATGLTVTFAKRFFMQPTITPSLVSATAGSVSVVAQSTSEATFKVFNTAGTAVAGVINLKVEGT